MARLHLLRAPLRRWALLPTVLGLALFATTASAQLASSLLNEGDPLPAAGPGHVVTFLNNTAVNHASGYAVSLSSSDGTTTLSHVWGHAAGGPGAIMRTEGTYGSLVQTSFESFYGMANDGSLAYSASGTGGPVGGFDSVWLDDVPVMVEGDPYPHAPDTWWRFGSRPSVTADGIPYFVGGLTSTQGGSTENYGLFAGLTGAPVYVGGDLIPGLPLPLKTSSSIDFDYRISEFGNRHLVPVLMDASTTEDGVLVKDGAGLLIEGSLVREASPVPVGAGGEPGENWDNFDYMGVNEAGDYFFTGDTDGATTQDEFVVKNGTILLRESGIADGRVLTGSIEGGYMNADGDFAVIWDVVEGTSNIEALYLGTDLLVLEGDIVDLDGDGAPDPGAVLANFTGISALTVSDRDGGGSVNVYFTADVDTAGTSSSTDDIEGFYCVNVLVGPVPVRVSQFTAVPLLREPAVVLTWQTSLEIEHAGFHVYRGPTVDGPWTRRTDELVSGRSPYEWVDRSVRGSSTYFYRLGAIDLAGAETFHGPVSATTPGFGRVAELLPSSPNPFFDRSRVRFTMGSEARATLEVFDVTGRRVATLVDEVLPAGDHEAWWSGGTPDGRRGAGGVYFYRLTTPDGTQTRKTVRLLRD